MQQTLDSKSARRIRLMNLPYPEKTRIVAQMRAAAQQLQAAAKASQGQTMNLTATGIQTP